MPITKKLSLIHIDVYKRQMQYLGLADLNVLGNGFVNDRQVDTAVMGISLRSVMTCSTFVYQLSMNLAMVSLTIGRMTLRLWVYHYDWLWHAAVSYTHLMQYHRLAAFNDRSNGFVNDRQVDNAVMGIS